MRHNSKDRLTLARRFLEPSNTTHRQYEALRAFFVDRLPSAEAAARFGYTPASFRVLVHQFRHQPDRAFFVPTPREGRPPGRQRRLHDQVVALRKQNLSVHDISRALARDGESLSPAAVAAILKREGFAKLPRRRDDERSDQPRPVVAEMADVRRLDLAPRQFHTKFGGLFLFLPWLTAAQLDKLLARIGFPGSQMVPAACAVRSLLALKLFGNARHSHVMSSVLDEGLALSAGLNVVPKRSFLTEYSCRVEPACYPALMRDWFDTVSRLGLEWGTSFDLDFHTIPFHGDDALVEKHYVSKRSRRPKGMLAFLAQDADTRVFCYANGELRKGEQNDEVLRFVEYWKQRTGRLPEELIFDSKLTTYANLSRLNRMGIRFITLRRRPVARGADLRFQADDLRQPQPIEPDGDPVHHPATTDPATPRRDRPDTGVGLVAHRTGRPLAGVQDPARPGRADRAERLRWTAPAVNCHRPGARGADAVADQPAEALAGPPGRSVCPADAHREQHRGWDRLLPHGRAVLGGGPEDQLRPATDADGQQPVSPAGGPRRSWLRGGQVAASVPGPDGCFGGGGDHRG